jgi:hypothetical protein
MNPFANNLIITKDYINAFTEHAVIEPPVNISEPKRYFRYVVDSRDRHRGYFKDPNIYDLKLSEDIHDVQSVELLSYDIPFTKYLINQYNNKFFYEINGLSEDFEIDKGDYVSGDQLVLELNNQQTIFKFKYNAVNQKISIKKTVSENINIECGPNFKKVNNFEGPSPVYKNSLFKIIGLGLEQINGITMNFLEFPYKIDLRSDEYIIMNLENANVISSENITTNKSFSIIKKKSTNNIIERNYIKEFNPCIASLGTLKVTFKDYDGNLYDFQNHDHVFELLFCCYKQPRKYSEIFI